MLGYRGEDAGDKTQQHQGSRPWKETEASTSHHRACSVSSAAMHVMWADPPYWRLGSGSLKRETTKGVYHHPANDWPLWTKMRKDSLVHAGPVLAPSSLILKTRAKPRSSKVTRGQSPDTDTPNQPTRRGPGQKCSISSDCLLCDEWLSLNRIEPAAQGVMSIPAASGAPYLSQTARTPRCNEAAYAELNPGLGR